MMKVEGKGYLSKDGEVRNSKQDEWMLVLNIPVWQGKNKPAMWISVLCLDSKCHFINFPKDEKFVKGDNIRFKGNMIEDHYTKKDGTEGTKLLVFAEEIEVLLKEGDSYDEKKPVRKNKHTE